MSTDPTILRCLMKVTGGESLQMFDKVTIVYGEEQYVCFLCIGKHNLYFVSKEMTSAILDKKLGYLEIDKAAICTKTNRRLLMQLASPRSSLLEEDKLVIRSDFRQQLVDRIAVCWQAEFMYRNFRVARFPIGKTDDLPLNSQEELHNIDNLQVQPFIGYDQNFSYRGYSFFLREGFKDISGTKTGSYRHEDGWEVSYGYASNKVIVPPECQVTVHVSDPASVMELEKDPEREDLRTVATNYRLALSRNLDQLYVLVNNPYNKRLNRTNDLAQWEGWEILIRSRHSAFVCVLLRRTFIPPLCDLSQDIAVYIRCPVAPGTNNDTHEVLMDECRYIADSIAPLSEVSATKQLYIGIIQARLDALQFNEEGYLWLKGHVGLEPAHFNLGLKFIKSLATILDYEAQNFDEELLKHPLLDSDNVEAVANPLAATSALISDYQDYLGDAQSPEAATRRNAWTQRISRYIAFCVDGGLLGDRFTLSNIVGAVGKCSNPENDKLLRNILEYFLHARKRSDMARGGATRTPLMQLLQEPDLFAQCDFNERVMRVLLMDNYIQNEWRKRQTSAASAASVHYEKLLAALLQNTKVGIGLRTLICRQILETVHVNSASSTMVDKQIEVLVPALINVMEHRNVNLVSCATAALVNLSCNYMATKTLLMQQGCMKLMLESLKRKDDDLTLYTLYLLVNMSKTPQHRSVIVSNGGLALLVDILSSSYQNLRKRKILTELCSVFGQLCNDAHTRSMLSDDYPVPACLLWIFDAVEPNSKLKSKLLFALRQLCGSISRFGNTRNAGDLSQQQNKIKIGQHVIYTVTEELGMARNDYEEVVMNAVLLLIVLADVDLNAREIAKMIKPRLVECRMMSEDGVITNKGKFSDELIDKVQQLDVILRKVAYDAF